MFGFSQTWVVSLYKFKSASHINVSVQQYRIGMVLQSLKSWIVQAGAGGLTVWVLGLCTDALQANCLWQQSREQEEMETIKFIVWNGSAQTHSSQTWRHKMHLSGSMSHTHILHSTLQHVKGSHPLLTVVTRVCGPMSVSVISQFYHWTQCKECNPGSLLSSSQLWD